LLESIAIQTLRDISVVVVDQSDEGTAHAAREALAELPSHIERTYIKRSIPGLSSARNVGIAAVDRQLVTFPDDDCWYERDHCERVWRYFETHPGLDFVIGRYGETDDFSKAKPLRLWSHNALRRVNSITLTVSRTALAGMPHPFDPRLGLGSELAAGEETDLVLRLLGAGAHGRFEPSCFVYHPAPTRNLGGQRSERARAAAFVISRHAVTTAPGLLVLVAYGVIKRSILAALDQSNRRIHLASLDGYWLGIRERLTADGFLG
jgi:hypothetical protein